MVVFDGYKEFTTKDMTHKRHLKGKKGVSVTFSLDMSLSATQEAFLSDPKNKQQFIFLAQDSQVKVAVFSTTKQMQTCLLFKRQLSQQIQTYSSFCYTTCLHTAKIFFLPRTARKIQKDECGTLKRSKQNWALSCANTYHFCTHF